MRDHLIDVEDSDGGPTMLLRTGSRMPIAEGSWIVNCTGFLGPRDVAYDPYKNVLVEYVVPVGATSRADA